MTSPSDPESRLAEAERLAQGGHAEASAAVLEHLHREHPSVIDAPCALAQLALNRSDVPAALEWLNTASRIEPGNTAVQVDIAQLLLDAGDPGAARERLEQTVRRAPEAFEAWLVLARVRDRLAAPLPALQARYEAVTRAQQHGVWTSPSNTPPHLQPEVLQAVQAVRQGRSALLHGTVADLRDQHGRKALERIDEALAIHLGQSELEPPHPQQRPRFLYVPHLPQTPYPDPYLHPWAARLRDAFAVMRGEVVSLLAEEQGFPGFIDFKPGDKVEKFLASNGPPPSWEAYFFFRHGQRYDDHHRRCPRTSEVLENIDLCRITGQAPEICFSILRPGSHILPHHGVTNARLVMHLPLIIPSDCALNLIDVGSHAWREGEPVMFDDTYLHESWNRSTQVRVILLMDCWNPHLTLVEREAVARISAFANALRLASERVDR